MLPWIPLARGFVMGNRRAGDHGDTLRAKTDEYAHRLYYQPSDFEVVDRITAIAKKRGISNAQVALAWILAQPGVSAPIIGASKMAHLEDAIASLQVKLNREELDQLSEGYVPHRILGHA